MIDPQIDPIEKDEIFSYMSDEEKIAIKKTILVQKSKLPEFFEKEKHRIIKYKQSEVFQKYKKEKDILTPKAFPSTWKWLAGNNMSGCPGKVPCYRQFKYNYVKHGTEGFMQVDYCYTGCIPVGVAIIFGYHDRNGKPNLIK